MIDSTPDAWRPKDPWRIVRADLNLAQVFKPESSFRFQWVQSDPKLGPGYRIADFSEPLHPNCFSETFLRPAGSVAPTFEIAAKRTALSAYSVTAEPEYDEVIQAILDYVTRNHQVQRLEGVVHQLCHAPNGLQPNNVLVPHPQMWIKTPLHIYRFDGVFGANEPLLLVHTPLSPLCPINTDGSAVGLAH
jgi:hypothetical protein